LPAAPRVALLPGRSVAAPRPSIAQIDLLNIGLMLGTAALAARMPFELFLFAYAALGPLHYLTEISWLHDRGYFTTGRWDIAPLVGLAGAGLASYLRLIDWAGAVFLAFALSTGFAFARGRTMKLVVGALSIMASLVVTRWGPAALFFAVLLPTVVHVFAFTALFILHGALRHRSPTGFASLAVFLGCGAVLLFHHPPAGHYAVSASSARIMDEFASLIDPLAALFPQPLGWDALAAIGRFLAFAYTYHYLNWFSKTQVIRWHEVSRARLALVAGLYAASLVLYAIDYRTGLVALFFLSLLHVLLEFPLDLRTLAGMGGRAAIADG